MADSHDYLLFRLYAPLAAWGDIAVGEVRPSFERPSRSAVLGLVAAALGIRRDREDELRALDDAYGYAVAVQAQGVPLRDYHTVQRPPQRKGAAYATRRAELSALPRDALATTLSYRDYWQDAVYVACLWTHRDDQPYSLKQLAMALKTPCFALYLGRKSCPPALPLAPHLVKAEDVAHALRGTAFPDNAWLPKIDGFVTVYSEQHPGGDCQQLRRRDRMLSRRRWQFAERDEYRYSLNTEV
jgi:CRISPR system Cascade subunit CasD